MTATIPRRRFALALVAAVSALTLANCASPAQPNASSPASSGTPAAPQSSAPAESSGEVTPLALNANGVLGGSAPAVEYDAGESGVVSVLAVGPFEPNSGTAPFLFRNNTSEGISHVDASATVRDSAGTLVASGNSQGTSPAQIEPGGIGLAYIYVGDGSVPDGAAWDFTFETMPADTSFFNTGDLQVTEANATGDGIVGTATNNTDATLAGPYSVNTYCFDAAGALVSSSVSYANESGDTAPGGSVSFSTSFYGNACPTFLVGVSGYFN